jgi:hypothetical protein
MYEIWIDDVELTGGDATTRHYVENRLTLTTMEGDTLYMGTTENNYMQLPTEALEEGQLYKVSVTQSYSSGLTSEEAICRWVYAPCDNLEGANDLTGFTDTTGIVLSWTYPVVNDSTTTIRTKSNGNRDAWDLLMTFTAPESGHYGVAYDGDNFYTSNWGYSSAAYNFYKYDLSGNMIEGFNISGCGTLRGMTYDGQYFYGVANSSTVYCIDLANHTLINMFTSEYGTMRGITYDPQRDGFWVIGNWSGNLTLIDRNGVVQFYGPEPSSVSDIAYYMDEDGVDHVFCFNNGDNCVYDYNIMTNTLEGAVFNFSNTPGYDGGSSGGCTVGEYDGKMAFIGDIQQSPNLIGVYELRETAAPEPSPIGAPFAAAIFRDGEWIGYTVDPMFIDADGTEANTYEVRIVYDGAKQCPYNNAYFSMSCPQTVLFPHEITAIANPTEGGTVTGEGTYYYGDTCTLTATANENYAFINWTDADGVEVSTEAEYSFMVTADAAFVANFELTTIVQTTSLALNWNWWSTYVEADDLIEQLEASLGANGMTIKSQNGFVQYLADYDIWYGSQNFSITNEAFYMIQTSAACDVQITGLPANPTEHPITLSHGWNWIGYPNNVHLPFTTAFSNITPSDNDQVKSQSHGFASYMEAYSIWYGTLSDYGIDPGMGLMYKSNNNTAFDFTYPTERSESETAYTVEDNHWMADYHTYAENMTITAVVELDDVELSSDNYELAAFANGELRGSARLLYVEPLHRYMAFLTVPGDEAVEISFGLYDNTTGMENFNSVDGLVYTTNAVVGNMSEPLVVRFRSTTSIADLESNLHVYPNPVNHGERFSIDLPEGSKVRVEIVNALGAVLSTETSTKAPASILAPNTAGIYTLRITVEGKGTYCRKLVVK